MFSAETRRLFVKWSCLAYVVAVAVVGLVGCQDRPATTAGLGTVGGPTVTTGPDPIPSPKPVPMPAPTPAVDVGNGAVVINAFGDNLLAAEKTWVGKRVRQRSMFREVRKETAGPRAGQFYAVFHHFQANVYIDPAAQGAFAGLKNGASVTFEADVAGYEQDVPDAAYGIWLTYDGAKVVRAE